MDFTSLALGRITFSALKDLPLTNQDEVILPLGQIFSNFSIPQVP